MPDAPVHVQVLELGEPADEVDPAGGDELSDGLELAWKRGTADADLVHYHTFGPLALHNRRSSRGVSVLTAHSTPRINQGNIAFARRINRLYPSIYAGFDHIVTVSEPCHREVIAKFGRFPHRNAALGRANTLDEQAWLDAGGGF